MFGEHVNYNTNREISLKNINSRSISIQTIHENDSKRKLETVKYLNLRFGIPTRVKLSRLINIASYIFKYLFAKCNFFFYSTVHYDYVLTYLFSIRTE
jgi:hypothetical protein